MSWPMSKTSFTPSEMVQVRMFFLRDAESGLAVQMVDAPRAEIVKQAVWLPVSQIYKTGRAAKEKDADYPAHILTIPKWLCDQKNLAAFVV